MEVACVTVPRLALLAACGGSEELLERPLALAPAGGGQSVGDASAAAEKLGVGAGMRLGEALSRCPELRLVAPDPGATEEMWERAIRGLEAIGAAVESERLGEAFFAVAGLRGIHGGDTAGVIDAAREAAGPRARAAAAPSRFAAALAARRGEAIVSAELLHEFLAPIPVSALAEGALRLSGREAHELTVTLSRLGIRTIGRLATLSPAEAADRFGPTGLEALRMARGEDTPLRPREPHEELVEEIELPEGTAGGQLDRALELLIDRLLAAPRRRQRMLISLRLGASLCGGGSWSAFQGLGRPTASARVLRSLLTPRLETLPGPVASLRLRALSFGPPGGDQLELSLKGDESRRRRLAAAVREVRAAAGAEALLKVLAVDADSRVPERREMLTPFPEP